MADGADRELAARTHNATWELLERPRSSDEDLELVALACASRFHWRLAGGPTEWAIADWMVSRCLAVVGDGALSLRFARLALETVPADAPAWLRASLLEGLARAHAAAGDRPARDEAARRAAEVLVEEHDEEDRALIAAQLASVPDGPS